MNKFNYCFDECEHNQGPRHYWEETTEDGKKVRRGKSDASNKSLDCLLGYKQSVNSFKGLKNSQAQGTRICQRLVKLLIPKIQKKEA